MRIHREYGYVRERASARAARRHYHAGESRVQLAEHAWHAHQAAGSSF
jgi:hypothetical protein